MSHIRIDKSKAIKKWYSNIADIRQKHDLVAVMRDNAGETYHMK